MAIWQKTERKALFTLAVDGYAPAIIEITFPLLRHLAKRMGAEFVVIKDRRFPGWPPVYEKLQIYQLAQEMGNDWNMFLDADALVHPECIDFTLYLSRDTVAHMGCDVASVRWTYDRYFRRDGRNIGSCNWCALASDWCVELWKPLDDLTLEEALAMIQPTVHETRTVVTPEHLIDDFTLSRNIARYGLKFKPLTEVMVEQGLEGAEFFWHAYTISTAEKVEQMRKVLTNWKVD